jgi:hypothetical protein
MSDATAQYQDSTLAQVLAALKALEARVKSSPVENLPPELGRSQILPTEQAIAFVGSSPANWRRLRALKIAPAPVLIGAKKHGYRIGDLVDYLERRSQAAPVDEPRRDPRHVLTSEPARA